MFARTFMANSAMTLPLCIVADADTGEDFRALLSQFAQTHEKAPPNVTLIPLNQSGEIVVDGNGPFSLPRLIPFKLCALGEHRHKVISGRLSFLHTHPQTRVPVRDSGQKKF